MSRFAKGQTVRVREDVKGRHEHDMVEAYAGMVGPVEASRWNGVEVEYCVDISLGNWKWFFEDELEKFDG